MLYTVHSAHARLMTVHVPVDVKVHMYISYNVYQARTKDVLDTQGLKVKNSILSLVEKDGGGKCC